ncbi:glycoside hydrolase family 31 protein [Streptomyces sp. LX-29]|uniref:glycoside hydrolase family 31 protein n=1 Tax=Streptomyces sp. LX-29 TaxID=2900152 RepID=UPI00240E06F2|nr:glycoside hydrolase family 31 protein [Streptomyces sp. LX-29]WFB06313.1 glycoside hydrolase family 31 protein [Streptomyces sp. LX-29]
MDARDLVRTVRSVGTAQGLRSVRSAWRRSRADAVGLPPHGPERARVPGVALTAEPAPGGGVVRFARSTLRVRVAAGGAVFCGWDGAGPEPSYALAGPCPDADERAVLEPDTDGGWRVVSERVTVVVSRLGAVEVRTPGGVVLRRDLPPRWWEPAGDVPAGRTGRSVGRANRPTDRAEAATARGGVSAGRAEGTTTGAGRAAGAADGATEQATVRRRHPVAVGDGRRAGEARVGEAIESRDRAEGDGTRRHHAEADEARGDRPGAVGRTAVAHDDRAGSVVDPGAVPDDRAGATTGSDAGHAPASAETDASAETGEAAETGASSDVGAAVEGGAGRARWVQRSEVAADARFFGLGGRSRGPRLRDGSYRLWNTDPGGSFEPGDDPLYLTMPVQLVVADAGTHLVFHDNSWDGVVTLREGEEGAGSGHDRPGACQVRMDGGPLRYWVIVGTPARVLHGWTALTGAPAVPPGWALGYHHARWGFGDEREVRRVVAGYRERDLPLSALHLDIDHYRGHRVFTVDTERFPDLPGLAAELRAEGVQLVSIIDPAVKLEPGNETYDAGVAADAFVRDARGRVVRGVVWPGEAVFPDFTDPRVRTWWGGLYPERLAQGFSGFWHDMNEPVSFAAFGDPTLPRSARHALEGHGGDHREAHNVYALAMARAGYEALRELRPAERPFLFSRSGWAGMQRYGGSWSGDVATGWAGLRASLALVLGLGLCGVPYSGPDVGGFTGSPSPELYLRWFQLASYLPLFRTHSAVFAGRREPWEFGPRVLEHATAALRERRRLLPYFVTLAHVARRTGAPYARPVWWRWPQDRALRDCEDAFLLGDSLLVAPVLEEGVERRAVRLPRGRWYDTATGRAYEGPGRVWLDAPLARVPVLARAGSVVPVAGPDGGVELEVWTPAPGRTGGGMLITDSGDGWEPPTVARFTTRLRGGDVVVEQQGSQEVTYPFRVRG